MVAYNSRAVLLNYKLRVTSFVLNLKSKIINPKSKIITNPKSEISIPDCPKTQKNSIRIYNNSSHGTFCVLNYWDLKIEYEISSYSN